MPLGPAPAAPPPLMTPAAAPPLLTDCGGGGGSDNGGASGAAYCWGGNNHGKLGDGTTTSRPTLAAVTLPSGVTGFKMTGNGNEHSCGIGSNDRAYCWGRNLYGELGDGTGTAQYTPAAVALPSGVTGFRTVSTGGYWYNCGIGSDDRAYCWGRNEYGKLGDGTTTNRTTPVAVTLPSGVTGFKTVAASNDYTCGIGSNDRAYCWGRNQYGQLGDGTTTTRTTPVAVTLPSGVTGFKAVTANSSHTCGIGFNDRVYCWGQNVSGQLGDGTTTNRSTPVAVTLPSGVAGFKSIGNGGSSLGHSCGIGFNDRAYCWGLNVWGQLGDNGPNVSYTPVEVTLPSGVTGFKTISMGSLYTCGIGSNDRAYCWGDNDNGKLGDGTTTRQRVPVAVILPSGIAGFKTISADVNHTSGTTL